MARTITMLPRVADIAADMTPGPIDDPNPVVSAVYAAALARALTVADREIAERYAVSCKAAEPCGVILQGTTHAEHHSGPIVRKPNGTTTQAHGADGHAEADVATVDDRIRRFIGERYARAVSDAVQFANTVRGAL